MPTAIRGIIVELLFWHFVSGLVVLLRCGCAISFEGDGAARVRVLGCGVGRCNASRLLATHLFVFTTRGSAAEDDEVEKNGAESGNTDGKLDQNDEVVGENRTIREVQRQTKPCISDRP